MVPDDQPCAPPGRARWRAVAGARDRRTDVRFRQQWTVPYLEAHRLYTRSKNFRAGLRGWLFQGRFGSCVLDEPHLFAAARYVDLNPVAAGLVARPEEYAWSSARFHLDGRRSDPLVRDEDRDLLGLVDDWRTFLQDGIDEIAARRLESHLGSGRPCGSDGFVGMLEKRTGRELRPRKRGWRAGRARK